MVAVNNLEACIDIEGNESHEYEDEELNAAAVEAASPTVARYIEAQPGRKFAIRMHMKRDYKFPADTNSLSFAVSIDGRPISRRVMPQHLFQKHGQLKGWLRYKRSYCDGQWSKFPFVFSELDITQENIKPDSKAAKTYRSLATIEVRVLRYHMSSAVRERSHDSLPTVNNTISEKALKGRGITLGATFGDAIPSGPRHCCSGYDIDKTPLAVFVFHYRTKKSLQDLMVLPKDDFESMTAEELRPLLRQEMGKNASEMKKERKVAIKREVRVYGLDSDDSDDVLQIRESKRPKIVASEVIEID